MPADPAAVATATAHCSNPGLAAPGAAGPGPASAGLAAAGRGAAAGDALVLVNLGTPAAPTPGAVRRYLVEFLSDRRVVQIPPVLWQPVLRGVVLPLRCGRVAGKYAEIWMDGGSPLAVHTRALVAAVQARLPQVHVFDAMRYGRPALSDRLRALRGFGRVLVLPLYPQYSTTTTASVVDVVAAAGGVGASAGVRVVEDYHLDPRWAAAVADSVRAHWAAHGRGERLLFSFHGIPQRVVDAGDPYARQCQASTAVLAAALGVARGEVLLTYQSRFGRERWLQPYTLPTVQALARAGVRTLDVACPGFAVDCLETLEEIVIQNAQAFRSAGGCELRYIPCLNDAAAHADTLAALARRQFDDWSDDPSGGDGTAAAA